MVSIVSADGVVMHYSIEGWGSAIPPLLAGWASDSVICRCSDAVSALFLAWVA